mmetsp:Transcript_1064/g.1396  ORF Transcript_1064/g.1396 Transcript_1064/m.1396 type:complete len:104 (+) Transcript_1064:441-752(+)
MYLLCLSTICETKRGGDLKFQKELKLNKKTFTFSFLKQAQASVDPYVLGFLQHKVFAPFWLSRGELHTYLSARELEEWRMHLKLSQVQCKGIGNTFEVCRMKL